MEMPWDIGTAAWYKYSPTPGEIGPSVIVGHLDGANYANMAGIFYRLRELVRRATNLQLPGPMARLGAGWGSRNPVSSLENLHINRYTNPARTGVIISENLIIRLKLRGGQ
jgi:hypothetical protein